MRNIIVCKGREYDGEQEIIITDGDNKLVIGTIYEFGKPKDYIINELNVLLRQL